MSSKHQELAGFIWSVADLLRGDYKQSDYSKVILPLTVLRRLDCVLAPTRLKVLEEQKSAREREINSPEKLLKKAAGYRFYNTSKLTFERGPEGLTSLLADQDQVGKNLRSFIGHFSDEATEILTKYDFDAHIARLESSNILYQVVAKFAAIDLHPKTVSNQQMGYLFEELIRRFSELSNETAGEHFTPREVIKLMTNLLLDPDHDKIVQPGATLRVLDPACGTGGMLSAAEDVIKSYNGNATVTAFGQELNPESYAICKSDLLIKNPEDTGNIAFGNSFSHDKHFGKKFDYLLANPPFGVEWKKVRDDVEREAELGHAGRFGAGLPRINDGSLLFLQHMIAHMKSVEQGGSRVAIVFNGSPLFTGAAESGESNIRRWILENDWLEGIVALPDQLFYNTGISTYFWILSNRKAKKDRGKVVLLDAREYWSKMRKSLGDKRKYVTEEQIEQLTRLYNEAGTIAADEDHELHEKVKIFDTTDFGYQRITVERPLRQRFEVTEDTVAEVEAAKPMAKFNDREALLAALRGLIGRTWWKKVDFDSAFHAALAESGSSGKLPAPVNKAVLNAVAVADSEGELQTDKKGYQLPDADLRDNENVPLDEDIDAYMSREVLPHVPDAWVDHTKTKIGYEIPFTRHFYKYVPPRPLAEIDAELKQLESEIQALLSEVTE